MILYTLKNDKLLITQINYKMIMILMKNLLVLRSCFTTKNKNFMAKNIFYQVKLMDYSCLSWCPIFAYFFSVNQPFYFDKMAFTYKLTNLFINKNMYYGNKR